MEEIKQVLEVIDRRVMKAYPKTYKIRLWLGRVKSRLKNLQHTIPEEIHYLLSFILPCSIGYHRWVEGEGYKITCEKCDQFSAELTDRQQEMALALRKIKELIIK